MLKGYLAGPIENQTINQACSWRVAASERFLGLVHFYNPMSGKENVASGRTKIRPDTYEPSLANLTNPSAIFGRDLAMINDADFLLVCSLRERVFSKGTMFEIGYAYAKDKLIVLVSKEPGIVEHPFLVRSCVIYPTLEDAYEFIESLARGFAERRADQLALKEEESDESM